jgi:hypothetical protein
MTLSSDQVTSMQKWANDHSPHVSAAVGLLAWHEHWFRRSDFLNQCVNSDVDGITWINWAKAREAYDSGLRGSTSELAALDLAIALGENRYRLSQMGHAHSKAILRAITEALT